MANENRDPELSATFRQLRAPAVPGASCAAAWPAAILTAAPKPSWCRGAALAAPRTHNAIATSAATESTSTAIAVRRAEILARTAEVMS